MKVATSKTRRKKKVFVLLSMAAEMDQFKRSISADSFEWLVHEDASVVTDTTDDIWREPESGSLILIPDYELDVADEKDKGM